MKPSMILNNLDKVQEEMKKWTLPQLVNHEYVSTQLGLFFKHDAAAIINQFKSNYLVLISDPEVKKTLEGCDKFSILNSLICLTKDGLSIHPYDKEAAIVPFKIKGVKTAVAMPMARGRVKKMQHQGIIVRIQYLEVVYDCDECSNVNGIWEHSINLKRTDEDEPLGVLLMVLMPDNTIKSKYVRMSEIEKRQDTSEFPEMWDKWPEEMWKKTVINMFEKEIGKKPLFNFVQEKITQDEEEVQETNYSVQPDAQPNTETQADEPPSDNPIIEDEQPEAPVEKTTVKEDDRAKNIKELRQLSMTAMTDQERKRMEELLDEMPDKTLKDTLTALQNRIKNMEEKKKEKTEEPAEEEPPI